MKLFAVAGDPILKSKSPDIWNGVFDELGIDAHYFRIQTSSAKDAVRLIKEIGITGCNITAPLKEDILEFIDVADSDVKNVSAANSLIYKNGKIYGYNTDVYGVTRTLMENGFDPKGKKAVVLGAGGAARAAVYALLKAKAGEVIVANRTLKKAQKLAKDLECRAIDIKKISGPIKKADVLVSCVPAIEMVVNVNKLHKGLTVVDANPFSSGSGQEWLVHQAEKFFKKFYNIEPVEYMRSALNIENEEKKSYSLIGFMGVGKSSYGQKLSKELKIGFIDLDAEIEKRENRTVADIFNKDGEKYFRQIEKEVLLAIDLGRPKVLSCGGGTVLDDENVKFLKENMNVIWLWDNIKSIRSRVKGKTRPLFDENVEQLLEVERKPLYAKACDVCIPTIL